jgi:hypothetical protein
MRILGIIVLIYIVIQEFYQWLYSNTINLLVLTGLKNTFENTIRHKINNTLTLQTLSFGMSDNYYAYLNCDIYKSVSPYNVFLQADTRCSNINQSCSLDLCSLGMRVNLQVDAILNITSYSLPILGSSTKCIEVFGNNSHITSKVFGDKMSHGLIVNHLEDPSEFSYSVTSTIFLKLLSPFSHDPFYRFVLNVLISPYSSSITSINDGAIKIFHTNTSDVRLCNNQEIVTFQDQTIHEFMNFYHTVNYLNYPRQFSKGIFQEVDVLPVWYKKLQEDNLELFKKLLLVIKIIKGEYDDVMCLIESGHGSDYALEGGVIPLIAAVVYNRYDIASSLLLQQDSCINCQDQYGFTALMYTVKKQEEKMVKLLLSYNADSLVLDNQKQSTLDMARQLHNERIVSALEAYSSNNNHVDASNSICSGILENVENLE